MGQTRKPELVKLVMPMFAQKASLMSQMAEQLATRFGPIDYESPLLPFYHTRYYEKEFGPKLKRRFYSYAHLIDRRQLADIKLLTNKLECSTGNSNTRQVNIDPGYLSPGKLVLATTKNRSHRIYLGQGIFAEVTLFYKDNQFQTWPWTYRDYATKEYAQILQEIRALYMKQRKANR